MHLRDLLDLQALLGHDGQPPAATSCGPPTLPAEPPQPRLVVVHDPYSFTAYGLVVEDCGKPSTPRSAASGVPSVGDGTRPGAQPAETDPSPTDGNPTATPIVFELLSSPRAPACP
eukprot:EG_transcript_51026